MKGLTISPHDRIETPERVDLDLDLAGIGSRGLACLLDTLFLLAGFVLLRHHDVTWATFTAMAINLAVALVALGLAKASTHRPGADERAESPPTIGPAWPVYVTIDLDVPAKEKRG